MTSTYWIDLVKTIMQPEFVFTTFDAEDLLWNETGFPFADEDALIEQINNAKEKMLNGKL